MRLLRRKGNEHPTDADQATSPPAEHDNFTAFVEEARWLLDYHQHRSDGFVTRAVALLGFDGVILALLARGLDPNIDVSLTGWLLNMLIATAGFLFASAICCLGVIWPRGGPAPKIDQLRKQWGEYVARTSATAPQAQAAEALLHSTKGTGRGPVHSASRQARSRGHWFTGAVFTLGAAITCLIAVVVQVFVQA